MRAALIALGVLALCADVSAMCGGGGMMGGGSRSGISGGARICGAGTSARSAAPAKKLEKAPMPAAVEVSTLDSSKFDSAISKMTLSDEQSKRIDALRQEVKQQSSTLATQQNDARKAYEKANCETSYYDAARGVMAAIQACKSFDANKRFESGVLAILSGEQKTKFRELLKS
ncbi:MAG TPA: Spy/CpxP family protein refolding chaperone [Planctomycetota bacterium]|nr:Spy/CpxP family protein refolding chaperone [Planctomycetota bacterium]